MHCYQRKTEDCELKIIEDIQAISIMERSKLIISIHVPKTVGTSFQKGLEERFDRRLLIDKEDNPLGLPVYC